MLKFIGAQVYQHQDDVIVEMGLPISTPQTPITTSTSNFTLVENGSLIELITQPNVKVVFTSDDDEFSFTSDDEGRVDISSLANGVYQVSVNNSQPEQIIMAKTETYCGNVTVEYYNPYNYLITIVHQPNDSVEMSQGNNSDNYVADDNGIITITPQNTHYLLEPVETRITYTDSIFDCIFTPQINIEPPHTVSGLWTGRDEWEIHAYGNPGYDIVIQTSAGLEIIGKFDDKGYYYTDSSQYPDYPGTHGYAYQEFDEYRSETIEFVFADG